LRLFVLDASDVRLSGNGKPNSVGQLLDSTELIGDFDALK
jgi:hypothetical protein